METLPITNEQAITAPPAQAVLMQLLFAPLLQQCICVAARLKLADLLVEPKTPAQLSALTHTHEDALYRVLRMLESVGFFHKNHQGQFELTTMASLLRSDVPGSMYSFALMMGEDWLWKNWGELMHCVKTGETAQKKVHGMGSFEYFSVNPKAGAVFNEAMTSLSEGVVAAIVEGYDFSVANRVADIAGGHGMLLAGILKANPEVKGILFELPVVIEGARSLLKEEGVSNRVELIAGDFLTSIPAGADLYLMKHIIHDWDDSLNTRILTNIRSVMHPQSKLLIIEMVVPEGSEPSPSKIIDLQMLIMEGGRERTAKEYTALLNAAGLQLIQILPTRSPYSIIEARRR